jgi:hypothetical protein
MSPRWLRRLTLLAGAWWLPPAHPADEELDSLGALHAAQDAGFKATIILSRAVVCPTVPSPTVNPSPLRATGAFAGLLVSPDGFLRADMGAPEAIAVLGRPVMCRRDPGSTYLDLYAAPSAANVEDAYVETHDGELIGVVVELRQPLAVDMTALTRRYGAPRTMPGPMDSHQAGSNVYDVTAGAMKATLAFAHKDRADPPTAWMVHQIIFRRWRSGP